MGLVKTHDIIHLLPNENENNKKKGMSKQYECKFLVHRESKLNWFRYKVKFIFAK